MTPGYLQNVRDQVIRSLCVTTFPSQHVERQTKPEVEMRTCPELICEPVVIGGGEEECLIEQSINSTRLSFKFKAADAVDEYLLKTYLRFMMHRCDTLEAIPYAGPSPSLAPLRSGRPPPTTNSLCVQG
jgi:actin related protein 2/3 complex subunit 4